MGTAAVATEDELDSAEDRDAALVALMESPSAGLRVTAADAVGAGSRVSGAVFQNFAVFTTGSVVRVVDADGSTYSGTIQPLLAMVSSQLDTRSDTASMAAARETVAKDDSGEAAAADLSLVRYSLVAAGTNRSLGQAVRFEGELALTEQQLQLGRNFFSNTIVSAGGAKGELLPASPDSATPGRLRGTAVLADGEDVSVDAVPTPR
jgi:hypothetical protein